MCRMSVPVVLDTKHPFSYVYTLLTIRHITSKSSISNSPKQKNAPDIHNDDYFPVLGAGGKRAGGWSTAGGAGGGAAGTPRADTRQPLALGNRFTSLQDDS